MLFASVLLHIFDIFAHFSFSDQISSHLYFVLSHSRTLQGKKLVGWLLIDLIKPRQLEKEQISFPTGSTLCIYFANQNAFQLHQKVPLAHNALFIYGNLY